MTKEEVNMLIRKVQSDFKNELYLLETDYEEKLDYIEKNCPHEWKYHSDPSGGNDSAWICEICDKESKGNPR